MKKRIKGWFENISLQWKFFAILLLALLMVFTGIMLTNRLTNQAYNDALYERTVQLLTVFSQNIQTELENAANVSFMIIADNVVQSALTKMQQHAFGTEEWIEARHEANDRLMSMSLLHSNVDSILLRLPTGSELSRVTPGKGIPAALLTEYAQAIRAAGGREIWIAETEMPGTLFLLRDVRKIADLSLDSLGVIALRVDMDKIVSNCRSPLADMGMSLLCGIDLGDTRVFASQPSIMHVNMGEEHFALKKIDGETMFCVRYSPQNSAWSYLAALPYDAIILSIRQASGLATVIALATLLLALALGATLTASIVRHFGRLLEKYDAFAQGQFQPLGPMDPYLNRRDEIGALNRRFDSMAAEHQRMINDIYVKQQLLLETQLRQLRSQIQPHFLYNTLESIYCLAEREGNRRIATMTGALGRMLRSALNDKREMVTVREDLKIAQDYLHIQLIRHGERLQADFRLEEDSLDALLPVMTLQPLVENAVRHGAEEMLDICRIQIFSRTEGKYIDLIVQDNGPGMDENIMEQIKAGQVRSEGMGIGLSNIQARLKMTLQDDQCGLRIRRENGKTQVIVRIKAKEKET